LFVRQPIGSECLLLFISCREEIGRYNMFASQAIDYYAHLQALERKVKKLGLRRSPMDVLRVLWYHLSRIAIAAWGVLKSPVQEGEP
jgi:hypothetical protein